MFKTILTHTVTPTRARAKQPSQLGLLYAMESLSVSYNSLTGPLPLDLRNMGGLVNNASTSLQLYIDCDGL